MFEVRLDKGSCCLPKDGSLLYKVTVAESFLKMFMNGTDQNSVQDFKDSNVHSAGNQALMFKNDSLNICRQ